MRAEILPLEGKYYGTEIETDQGSILIWITKLPPSERWLALYDLTKEDWENDIEVVTDRPIGTYRIRSELICDEHYESDISYKIAQTVVKALEELE